MSADSGQDARTPLLDEYSRMAAAYDTRWSFYVQATTRETLARLEVQADDRVLDVGCGTGALLHPLSAAHPDVRLAGVDPVAEMLAVARERLSPAVELREGWAEELPFEDAQFDLVVSCNMFHYIQQPLIALREMHRVLRPAGRLVITDWCDDYFACRICDWYLRLFDRAHYRTYRRRECGSLLRAAGFTVDAIDQYKISWMWGLMTVRATRLLHVSQDPEPRS